MSDSINQWESEYDWPRPSDKCPVLQDRWSQTMCVALFQMNSWRDDSISSPLSTQTFGEADRIVRHQ